MESTQIATVLCRAGPVSAFKHGNNSNLQIIFLDMKNVLEHLFIGSRLSVVWVIDTVHIHSDFMKGLYSMKECSSDSS